MRRDRKEHHGELADIFDSIDNAALRVLLQRILADRRWIQTGRSLTTVGIGIIIKVFFVMARGDVNEMPSHVPAYLDWVENIVLLSKSVMDEKLIGAFRKSHTICSEESEESKYELIPPNSEERVCYYNLHFPEERHFIYMYECVFSKLKVRVPFTTFEQEVLYECRVAPTQLHPNSWGLMRAFQVPSTNQAEFQAPPNPTIQAVPTSEKVPSRKRKSITNSYGSICSPDFDAVGFTDEFIMENSWMAVDEAVLKNNLEFIMKAGIKAAGIARAVQKKLAECPPTPRTKFDLFKERIATLEKEKQDFEEKWLGVKSEVAKIKKSAKKLEQQKKKLEKELYELQKKNGELEKDVRRWRLEYEQLEDDSLKSNDEIVENLRAQAKVLVPNLKVSLLHPENSVVDGRIVFAESVDLEASSDEPTPEDFANVPPPS
ncbi:hypothetical protein PIB30_079994 [Stylosanthes scabra]|uniref:Uncharacterized protein n=1 Tax=Stylosanthes scabra TaxID=79078 RepID=A0ABU6WPJ9_9FABA|nr:hypothetical protein [Stylosanthes scabra]